MREVVIGDLEDLEQRAQGRESHNHAFTRTTGGTTPQLSLHCAGMPMFDRLERAVGSPWLSGHTRVCLRSAIYSGALHEAAPHSWPLPQTPDASDVVIPAH